MAAVWPGTAVTDDSLVQCIHEIRRALGDDGPRGPQDRAEARLPARPASRDGAAGVAAAAAGDAWLATSAALAADRELASRAASPTAAGVVLLLVSPRAVAWWLTRAPPTVAPPRRRAADDRGPAVRQSRRRPGAGLFRRRHHRGPDHRPVEDLRRLRHRPELGLALQGQAGPGEAGGRGPGRPLRARRQRPARGRPAPDQRPAHRLRSATITSGPSAMTARSSDVFALQDKVIANIVSALAVELTSAEVAATGDVETTNPQAYDALLLGLEHLHRDTEEDTLKAVGTLREGRRPRSGLQPRLCRARRGAAQDRPLDLVRRRRGPDSTRAYNESDRRTSRRRWSSRRRSPIASPPCGLRRPAATTRPSPSIDKASALAPNDPEVLVSKALILNATGRAAEAEAELRLAMRLDPSFAPRRSASCRCRCSTRTGTRRPIDAVERILAQGADDDQRLPHAGLEPRPARPDRAASKEAIASYNALAAPRRLGPDERTRKPNGTGTATLVNYHRPYVERLRRRAPQGRRAGRCRVPTLPFADYMALIKRVGEGEFDVDGATEVEPAGGQGAARSRRPVRRCPRPCRLRQRPRPGAVNLSLVFDLSKEALAKVAGPDDEVAFYCHTKYCDYSAYASAKAVLWGYKHVYRFAGGFPAWKNAGYPIEAQTDAVTATVDNPPAALA